MKKVRGENDIEAVLQKLDRLTQDEGLATGAQTLQVVNNAERESFPICNLLRRPGTECDLQVTRWCGTSGNGFLLQIPGKTTILFMILGIAKPERG
jgi:hypothetical protein